MHNRVRMVVGSFLTKDLQSTGAWGERWFMRHLVDGDLANNNGGWQWIASAGTDPAPSSGASSTRPASSSASTPTATTCAAGSPSCARPGRAACPSRGR